MAIHAAATRGCRVTAITVSREQHELATERVAAAGLSGRVEIRHCDYREIRGTFDKIVSIEMLEAVGYDYLPAYFAACARALVPGGRLALQTITMPDHRFEAYRRRVDWMQTYIFPGSCIPSLAAIREAAAPVGLTIAAAHDIGPDYAPTLRAWRDGFLARQPEVRELGFDEPFVRTWLMYLAFSEAAFAERPLGDHQLLLTLYGMLPRSHAASFGMAACALSELRTRVLRIHRPVTIDARGRSDVRRRRAERELRVRDVVAAERRARWARRRRRDVQPAASDAGLPGTHVAYLSTGSTTAIRVAGGLARVAARRRRAGDRSALGSGRTCARGTRSLSTYESGHDVRSVSGTAWTGTSPDGTASTETCGDWTSGAMTANGVFGSVSAGGGDLSQAGALTCDHTMRMYCFGVGSYQVAPPPPVSGRLAFVSSGVFTPSGAGLPAADALCQAEATGASKPGTFLAALPTISASTASRSTRPACHGFGRTASRRLSTPRPTCSPARSGARRSR